jgi:hypothetical protein
MVKKIKWPAPAPSPSAADPAPLDWLKERRRAFWREAQAKSRAAKKRALCREEPKKRGRPKGPPPTWRRVIAFDAKQSYSDSRQRAFNRMAELETWNRAPRNLDEVQFILQAMAKRVGQTYGVFLNVGRRGDDLMFINEAGEDIVDPGGTGNAASSILCAEAREVDSGDFLKLFAARSLYAALTVRFNQADSGPLQ